MVRIDKVDGRWHPKGSTKNWKRYWGTAFDMRDTLKLVPEFGVALQAGGNLGAWPVWLAKRGFERVYTFEPDVTNWACLEKNIAKYPQIIAKNYALGDAEGSLTLAVQKSIGSHYIVDKPGDTWVTTIDTLNLDRLDLLVLDVEGFEYPALAGGIETIQKYKPIIQLEDRNHGVKKGRGHTIDDILELLEGYEVHSKVGLYDLILKAR
jgi:FkbM family methyltransferase